MMNDYEFNIEKSLNEDIDIPESVLMKKDEAFKMIKQENKNKKKKKVIAACTIFSGVVLGSVIFADSATAYIKEMFFNNRGVQTAVDNGYIKDMNNLTMEDKGVNIKVDKFLIDDSRAVVSMKINFEDQNIKDILKGLKVESQLLCNGEEIATSAKHEFSIDNSTKEITYNTVFSLEHKVEADEVKLSIRQLDLGTDLDSDVEWDESLSEEDIESISEENIKLFDFISGNWSTNIKIDEKFKNPEIIYYKQSEENPEIEIISAKSTPTGMDIEFSYKNQENGENIPLQIRKSLYDMKIMNSKGEEFKCDGFLNESLNEEGKSVYGKTFYETSFENEDNYTLEVKDLSGNVQKIKLEK